MPLWVLFPWVAFGIAMAIAQFRFQDAYIKRYGGPSRRELLRMIRTHPLRMVRLLQKPPFTLGAMFRRLDDALVDRRRSQYLLAALAGFGYLPALAVGFIVYGMLIVSQRTSD